MGVPKFYRWVSERYPCLSEVVRENQIPEFDNLYLDMNGIIHICSHPNDDDPHFRISEEKIFQDIFHYIEVLFRIIKPCKVFFMAVDGVAPRAKMNQQRGRRFRSARCAEEQEKKALQKGEKLPTEKRFDSNCITPGTEFMVKLQEQLKYFVNKKVTEDKMWHGVRVYLSGHETPGEGEHKIMDFIRTEKSHPDYDPNTRHCLYGLDADLMMLGLTSHEPHFSLLREEVRFGGKKSQKRIPTPEETTFHLLHLSLFREYLDFEFQDLKNGKLSFEYDLESIIDDWVMMGFLVGNDFIPHLPDLHIAQDALPLLYKTYIEVMPTLDGYINEGGTLNLRRFEKYLQQLSQFDRNKFSQTNVDLKYFEGKKNGGERGAWKGKRLKKKQEEASLQSNGGMNYSDMMMLDTFGLKDDDSEETSGDTTDDDAISKTNPLVSGEDDEEIFEIEFRQHKRDYYRTKLGFDNVTEAVLKDQAKCYVTAIQWILHYYYNGVQSWSWFYPYHYAPFMSDIKGFSDVEIRIDRGRPFLPFQQLLGVLPAASKELLPEAYQNLMIMDNSPIIEYYPIDFKTDLNGKQQDWEAVVLIPFIDEGRLLAAMEPLNRTLTEAEKRRNSHGPHLLYTYDEDFSVTYPSSLPGHFPDIVSCHARCKLVPAEEFQIDPEKMRKGLLRGTKEGVYYPGFPTMKHIPHSAKLKRLGVKVFQMNSRNENMILTIEDQPESDIEKTANSLLGKTVFASWPHLQEVRVVSVSDDEVRYDLKENKVKNPARPVTSEIVNTTQSDHDIGRWVREVQSITESYQSRKGVDIGQTTVLIHAAPLVGRKYICGASGVITLEKQWAMNPIAYALQTTVKDIAAYDPTYTQFKSLEELFPEKSVCFMLGSPHYGCMGEVIEIDRKDEARVRVAFITPMEPRLYQIMSQQGKYEVKYFPGYVLAKRLGISSHLVSRITGSFFVFKGSSALSSTNKVNIGLNLKFNKKNKEVPGYTRKNEEDSQWLYSVQTQGIIGDYISRYPELFDYIAKNAQNEDFHEEDAFGRDSNTLSDISEWLKTLPCHGIEQVTCGQKTLDENVVSAIVEEIDKQTETKQKRKLIIRVKPYLLFRPFDYQGNMIPDPEVDYELFDRVINIREGYTVPLGLRGVVVGIITVENTKDVLYDVIFDKEFEGALVRSCGQRGYHMPPSALINISYGIRKEHYKENGIQRPTAVVKTQHSDRFQGNRPERTKSREWYADVVKSAGSSAPDMRRGYNSPRINHSPNSPFVPSQTYSKGRSSDLSPHPASVKPFSSSSPYGQTKPHYTPPNAAKNQPLLQTPQTSSSHQQKNYQPSPRQQGQGSTSRQQPQKKDTPQRVMIMKREQIPQAQNKGQGQRSTGNADGSEFANMWKQLQDSPSTAKDDRTTSKAPAQPSLAMAAESLPMKSAQEEREKMRKSTEFPDDGTGIQQSWTPHKKVQIEKDGQNAADVSEDFNKILSTLNVATDEGTESTVTIVNSSERPKGHGDHGDGLTDEDRQSPSTRARLEEDSVNIRKLLHIGGSQQSPQTDASSAQQAPATPPAATTVVPPSSPYAASSQPAAAVSQPTAAVQSRPGPAVTASTGAPIVQQANWVVELLNWCQGQRMHPPRFQYEQNPNGSVVSTCSLNNGMRFQGVPCPSKELAGQSAAFVALSQLVYGSQAQQQHYPPSPRQPQMMHSPRHPSPLMSPQTRSVPVRMPNDGGVAIRSRHLSHQHMPANMQPTMGQTGMSPRQAFPHPQYHHHHQQQRPFPSPQQQYQQHYNHQHYQHQQHYNAQPYGYGSPQNAYPQQMYNNPQSNLFVPLQVTRQQKIPNKAKDQGQGHTLSGEVVDTTQVTSNQGEIVSQTNTTESDGPLNAAHHAPGESERQDIEQRRSSKPATKHSTRGRPKAKLAINFQSSTS